MVDTNCTKGIFFSACLALLPIIGFRSSHGLRGRTKTLALVSRVLSRTSALGNAAMDEADGTFFFSFPRLGLETGAPAQPAAEVRSPVFGIEIRRPNGEAADRSSAIIDAISYEHI